MVKIGKAVGVGGAGALMLGIGCTLAWAGGSASLEAAMGKALFKRNWLPAPSSTKSNDGLGPLFNARSCAQCHATATAGRIELTAQGDLADRGAVVRLSTSSGTPDPVYGAQLQTHAIPGHKPEGSVRIDWEYSNVTLKDGAVVELRKPRVQLHDLNYGEIATGVTPSLVLAPSLSIAAQIAKVDPAALPRDASAGGHASAQLFGRKMTEPTLAHAIATAFSRDLGLATSDYPAPAGDCTPRQSACIAGPHGEDGHGVEIAPQIAEAVTAYVASLSALQPSREADQQSSGQALFSSTGCESCHRPHVPGKQGTLVTLYSDLRLHDLGPGLAGVVEKNGSTASEWRTAPLLGIAGRLAAGATLLHDGRARSVEEAILWHGANAQTANDNYKQLTAEDRNALKAYVMSR